MEDIDDFDLLWCIECQCCHGPDCPSLGVLPAISDTPVQSKAVASLPSSLSLQVDSDGVRKVLAGEMIPSRTQFGPVDAPVASDDDVEKLSDRLLLKIFQKDGSSITLNQSDKNHCNWMCLVRPATTTNHQNLIAYQYKSALYYSATQDIPKDVELRVWYAPHYAPRLGQSLLTAAPLPESDADDEIEGCLTMDTGEHDDEDDGEEDDDDEKFVTLNQIDPETTISSPSSTSKSLVVMETSCNLLKQSKSCEAVSEIKDRRTRRKIGTKTVANMTKIGDVRVTRRSKRIGQKSLGSNDVESIPVSNMNDNNTPCPVCRQIFPKDDIGHHMKDHKSIETVRRVFKCSSCASSFLKAEKFEKQCATCHGNDSRERKNLSPHEELLSPQQEALSPHRKDVSPRKSPKADTVMARRSKRKGQHSENTNLHKHHCKECDLQFTTLTLLRKHCKNTHKASRFEGNVDDKRNKIKQNHIKQSKSKKFECPECDLEFTTLTLLRKHCKNTHKASRFEGNVDDKRNKIKQTKSTKKQSKAKDFPCPECDSIFRNESLLCKHLFNNHNIRKFTCKYCPRTFARRSSYQNHQLTHLKVITNSDGKRAIIIIRTPTESLFKCKECPCEFQKWDSYKKHMSQIHGDVVVCFCDVCCTTYNGEGELAAHMEDHEKVDLAEENGYHECDICHRLFLSPFKLQEHKDQHAKRKDHVCEYCGKGFARVDTLMRHKGSKHEGQQPSTVCTKCGLTFKTTNSVTVHMRLHEEETTASFVCSQCNKSFLQLGNYNKHLLTHAQKKQFKCEVCSMSFNHAQTLKRHSYRHIDKANKMHKCSYCGRSYCEKSALIRHQQDQHLNKRSCICEYCGLFIKRLESYYRHMRRKHPHVEAKDYKPIKVTKDFKDSQKKGEDKEVINETSSEVVIQNEPENQDRDGIITNVEVKETSCNNAESVNGNEHKDDNNTSQLSEPKHHEAQNSFSEDGELVKALTKLKQTISNVTNNQSSSSSKVSEPMFPLKLYESDDMIQREEDEYDGRAEEDDDEQTRSSPGLYLVVESSESHLGSEMELESEKTDNILGMEHVSVESEPQIVDSDILIMNLSSVDTLITLNTTSDDTVKNTAVAANQDDVRSVVAMPVGKNLEISSQTLTPDGNEAMSASVSPGPMLGNQSLISMPNETISKQFTIPPVMKSDAAANIPKCTPANSFISIESLLSLPSSSTTLPDSDQLYTSFVTQPINWQQSTSSHSNNSLGNSGLGNNSLGKSSHGNRSLGNTLTSHFLQGVKLNTIEAPKQSTNFSNISSLAMPSSSSGIQRAIKNPLLEPHQPVGQSIGLLHRQASQGIGLPHQPTGQSIALPHQQTGQSIAQPYQQASQSIGIHVSHKQTGQSIAQPHQLAGQSIDLPHQLASQSIGLPHQQAGRSIARPHKQTGQSIAQPHQSASQPYQQAGQSIGLSHQSAGQSIGLPHSAGQSIAQPHQLASQSIAQPYQQAGQSIGLRHQQAGQSIGLLHQPAGQSIAQPHLPAGQSITQPYQQASQSIGLPNQPAGQSISLPHPVGQTIDLSFLTTQMSGNSLKSLQQSSVGMQQFVPIAPSLSHIPTSSTI